MGKGRRRDKTARSSLSESLLSLTRTDLLRKSERWSVPAHTQINDNAAWAETRKLIDHSDRPGWVRSTGGSDRLGRTRYCGLVLLLSKH